jgi:hypothetical protein
MDRLEEAVMFGLNVPLARWAPQMLGERERMAVYRFGGLEGTLLRLGESGQMSMIG